MPFKTSKSYISPDLMLSGVDSYDNTTAPSNELKILAPDGAAGDRFGTSVSVGSGRIVVGAWLDTIDSASQQGSAYVYDLDGNYVSKIIAPDGDATDWFGFSSSVGSGVIVIGANSDEDNGSLSGSAYLYDLNGNYIKKILAPDGTDGDRFGSSVSVGSGRVVVGAYADDDNGPASGSAYIFDLDGNYIAKVLAPDGAEDDFFGSSVAVGSGRIVIGAPLDDFSILNSAQGSAHIYDINGNYIKKIFASDGAAADSFGDSVSVGLGRIVVGADGASIGGAVYVFDLNGNYITKIEPSDSQAAGLFGYSVSVGSGRIVVGSRDDHVGANADQGSIYVYDLDGNYLEKITSSDGNADDEFGYSVHVGEGRVVVGAPFDDDNGSASGSAYIYTTPDIKHTLDIHENYGITTPANSNIQFIGADGSTASTTVTIPTHQEGDLIIVFGFEEGGSAPVAPAGWTTFVTEGATTSKITGVYKFADASGTTSGTWSTVDKLISIVYRGTNKNTPIGKTDSSSGSSVDLITYPSLSLTTQNGTSFVGAVAMTQQGSLSPGVESVPSGMVLRNEQSNNTNEAAVFDTSSGVSSFSSRTTDPTGTVSYASVVFEVLN